MKTEFSAKLENGAVIQDKLYFPHKIGKGVLEDIFKNWKDLISNSYHVPIQEATYSFEN
jgi:hypothetical protein